MKRPEYVKIPLSVSHWDAGAFKDLCANVEWTSKEMKIKCLIISPKPVACDQTQNGNSIKMGNENFVLTQT